MSALKKSHARSPLAWPQQNSDLSASGSDLRHGGGGSPRHLKACEGDARGGRLAADAAVVPVRILLGQATDEVSCSTGIGGRPGLR